MKHLYLFGFLILLTAACSGQAITPEATSLPTAVTPAQSSTPVLKADPTAAAVALAEEAITNNGGNNNNGAAQQGQQGRTNLAPVGEQFGVTIEELQAALGSRPIDFEAAAATLSVDANALREAVQAVRGNNQPANPVPPATEEEQSDDSVETPAAETGTSTSAATISNTLIQLSDPLDETEYYCIDVPGFRQSINLDAALTAHTCKPNADDELFSINYPLPGQIYMPTYERCMEARAVDAEAFMMLFLTECSDSPLQQFTRNNDGTIQLQSDASEALCITIADGVGTPTGGPSHLWRALMLRPCTTLSDELAQWIFPGPTLP
ncbi:MAG: hypothetical protein AB8G95_24525 [Anaerolineae bacterium]